MANIHDKLNKIISAIFGKDVRQALYDGLDLINKETENTTLKQQHLEDTFNQLVINSGNSNAEIVDARVSKNGSKFDKLGERLDNFDSSLEENKKKISKINKIDEIISKIKSGEYTKFRYISDSIGLGASADGYGENPNGEITFDWHGDIHREPKRDVGGYVNYFREALKTINPSVDIKNASISGRSITEASNLRTGYIFSEGGEDVTIIALSINDLHYTKSISEFEEKYQIFIDYLKENNLTKEIILVTPTLVYLEENTASSNNLKVRQLVSSIIKLANKNELPYIDLFSILLDSINNGIINYATFFKNDNVHPSNEGHYLIYLIFCYIFKCSINDDSFYLDRMTRWSIPTFEEGIVDISSSVTEYEPLKYTIKGKNKVIIKGIVTGEALKNIDQKLFTISHVVAPKRHLMFNCIYNTSTGERKPAIVKIDNLGNVNIMGLLTDCAWLNIDIVYYK